MAGTPPPDPPRDRSDETISSGDAARTGTTPGGSSRRSSRGKDEPSFAPGDLVAHRYLVARFIARGGMGEVYEVDDRELGGRLALKTIRPDIAEDQRVLERFRREIHLARRVTHPNVSRVYDIGRHVFPTPDAETPPAEIVFLTMELLDGESLSDRLKQGTLGREEILSLTEQMAAGLHAAHSLGIIHRDFKSSNVMLVVAGPHGAARAVVTDFGLARSSSSEGSLLSISDAGAVVGTAAYMAPEQVEGRPLTPAADVYALGIVLYEMTTRVRPFDGGSTLSVAVKRLTQPPPPPSTHNPGIDPAWEAVILKCLARHPEGRFQTALEVAAALRGDVPVSPVPRPAADIGAPNPVSAGTAPLLVGSAATGPVAASAPSGPAAGMPARGGLRSRGLLIGAGLGGLLLAGGLYVGLSHGPAPTPAPSQAPTPAPVAARRSVAVLGLRNVSGQADVAWLGTALSEALTTELSVDGKLRAVPPQEVARARAEYGLEAVLGPDKGTLTRLRANLGADVVAFGSYVVLGDAGGRLVTLDLRLQDTASGQILATGRGTGTEAHIFDTVSRAAASLRKALDLEPVTAGQSLEVQASLPKSPEAARLYAEGLAKLRGWEPLAARDLLEKAVAAEPDHPLPRAALSDAWAALGYGEKAAAAAREAMARADQLPLEQKMLVEARLHEASRDWDKAIASYSRLVEMHPDDLDAAIRLANVQTDAGRPREAVVTLDGLARLPPSLSADPRIDIARARALEKLSDWRGQLAAATRAARKGEASGASLLMATALSIDSAARLRMGDQDAAFAAADRARDLYQAIGDRSGTARALNQMGIVLLQKGDGAGARRLWDRTATLLRETGDSLNLAKHLYNVGDLERQQGNLDSARRLLGEALATWRALGAKAQVAHTLNALGATLFYAGELRLAESHYREALAIFGDVGDRQGTSLTLTNLAEVLYLGAELDRARELHEESAAINREIGDKGGLAYDLYHLGQVFSAKGDLRVARDRLREALKLQQEVGDRTGASQVEIALAAVALEEGDAPGAEKLLIGAEQVLRTEGLDDDTGLAQVDLAHVLLAEGRLADAASVAARAATLAASSHDLRLRLTSAIVSATVRAATGKPVDVTASIKVIERTAAEAARRGAVLYELTACLARVEVAAASGRTDRAAAAALAKRARDKGLERIAQRAERAAATAMSR